jgi:hypothetical protein
MEKQLAFVTQKIDGRVTGVQCSICGESLMLGNDVGSRKEQEMKAKEALGVHMNAKHRREDSSQAALRIVREATEDK